MKIEKPDVDGMSDREWSAFTLWWYVLQGIVASDAKADGEAQGVMGACATAMTVLGLTDAEVRAGHAAAGQQLRVMAERLAPEPQHELNRAARRRAERGR